MITDKLLDEALELFKHVCQYGNSYLSVRTLAQCMSISIDEAIAIKYQLIKDKRIKLVKTGSGQQASSFIIL